METDFTNLNNGLSEIRAASDGVQDANDLFTCHACKHVLPNEFQIRTEGYCYLCDPNVTVEELLSSKKPLDDKIKFKTHELKTWPEYFDAIAKGDKTFDVRKNDRGFQIGDVLILKQWDNTKNEYTGSEITTKVTYVLKGGQFGIEEGYCVLGIKIISPQPFKLS